MPVKTHTETLTGLRHAAELEAEHFTLPPDWKVGREPVWGMAIDGEHTLDRDDAVAVSILEGAEGQYLVSVSFVDVGSFLGKTTTPAIEAYARRTLETKYVAHGAVGPMLPRPLSEHALSILNDREEPETPVLTMAIVVQADGSIGDMKLAFERMRPATVTYNQVANMKQGDDYRGLIEDYERVAQLVRRHRLSRGHITDQEIVPNSQRPGELIVSEFMVLANTAVAQYMVDNQIPGLYRNHNGELAAYSTRPRQHDGLKLERPYTHATSPLRRFPDFAVNANLVAHLRGEPYPYPVDELNSIAQKYNSRQERYRNWRMRNRQLMGAGAVARTVQLQPLAEAA